MSSSNLVRLGGGLARAGASVLLVLSGDTDYSTVLGPSQTFTARVALVALRAARDEKRGLLGSLGSSITSSGRWTRAHRGAVGHAAQGT